MDTLISQPSAPAPSAAPAPAPVKKGFPTVFIVIILALLGLGVGGYFAYANFIAPMLSPYAGMIPDELKEYAVGSNADAFLIVRNDKEVESITGKFPELAKMSEFKSALFLGSSKYNSALVVFAFSSAETAKTVKEGVDSMLKNTPGVSNIKINLEQKEKIVLASFGNGLSAFTGKFSDNPGLKSLDNQLLDSQVILYLNNYQMPETTLAMFAVVNTVFSGMFTGGLTLNKPDATIAHAQGFITGDVIDSVPSVDVQDDPRKGLMTVINSSLTLAKETTFYLKIKNASIKTRFLVTLIGYDEFQASPLSKAMGTAAGGIAKPEDIIKAKDQFKSQIDKLKPGLQKQIDDAKSKLPGSDIKFDLSDKQLIFEASVPQLLAEAGLAQLRAQANSGAVNARDTVHKVNVNDIIMALEQYNAANGSYPPKSACIDEIAEIQSLFKNGKSPVDANGPQDFKVATCKSGYYYQYAKKDTQEGYVVWGKMEGENGNTDATPIDYEKAEKDSGVHPEQSKGGKYYVVDNSPYFKPASSSVKWTTIEVDSSNQQYDDFVISARPVNNPTSIEFILNLAPGETAKDAVVVQSFSKKSGTVSIYAADKSAERLAKMKNKTDPNTGVGLWTTLDKTELSLAPGEKQTVNFSITVPPGTADGTYLGYLITAYEQTPNNGTMKSGLNIVVNVGDQNGQSGTTVTPSAPVHRIKRTGTSNTSENTVTSNPFSELAKANNAQRSSDILAVNDAIHNYEIENRGKLPIMINRMESIIGSGAGQSDICTDLVPTYLASMPFDPTAPGAHFTGCTDYNTGYTVVEDGTTGQIKISAPNAELGEVIKISN